MLCPPTVEFGTVIVRELKGAVTLPVAEAFPERDSEFYAVVGGMVLLLVGMLVYFRHRRWL